MYTTKGFTIPLAYKYPQLSRAQGEKKISLPNQTLLELFSLCTLISSFIFTTEFSNGPTRFGHVSPNPAAAVC